MELTERIKTTIRDIPDFPKEGIIFKDITPLLLDPQLSNDIVDELARQFEAQDVDAIAGIESRGFLFGLPVAIKMGVPFILVRKKGKLPYTTISYKYDLEYGSAEIEMHADAVQPGMKVMIHDDLLATGGTADAAAKLVESAKGQVAGFSFVVELGFLQGREKLTGASKNINSLVYY